MEVWNEIHKLKCALFYLRPCFSLISFSSDICNLDYFFNITGDSRVKNLLSSLSDSAKAETMLPQVLV